MIEEQLLFEEVLKILNEKGVDLETLFTYCYEKLKIDMVDKDEPDKNKSIKMLSNSFSCANSEFSLKDNTQPNSNIGIKRDKNAKLSLDFREVKNEILTTKEDCDS